MGYKVLVLMGSASDAPIMRKAGETLAALGIEYRMTVASAHRTPARVAELVTKARDEGYGVIIAGAGMGAHLAGVCASMTTLPVIGVPLAAGGLGGQDALLSTVQMPPGVPVACVAIDGARNAALLAAEIIALAEPELAQRLQDERDSLAKQVQDAARDMEGGAA